MRSDVMPFIMVFRRTTKKGAGCIEANQARSFSFASCFSFTFFVDFAVVIAFEEGSVAEGAGESRTPRSGTAPWAGCAASWEEWV